MTIQAECGGCGQVYLVDELKAGRSGKCKECGATFQVPALAQPPKQTQSPKQTQPAKPALPPKSAPKSRPQPAPKAAKPPHRRDEEYEDVEDLPPLVRSGKSSSSGKKRRSSGSGFRISFNWGLISKFAGFLIIALCVGAVVMIVPAVMKARQAARNAAEKKVIWSNFSFPDGKFSCDMPEGWEYSQRNGFSGLTSRVWAHRAGRLSLSAGFSDSSSIPDWQLHPVENMAKFPQAYSAMLRKQSQTIVSESLSTTQGFPSCELVSQNKGFTNRMLILHANSRLIILNVTYPTNDEPPNSKRIFETLKIE